jgi:hypothetical protein
VTAAPEWLKIWEIRDPENPDAAMKSGNGIASSAFAA